MVYIHIIYVLNKSLSLDNVGAILDGKLPKIDAAQVRAP